MRYASPIQPHQVQMSTSMSTRVGRCFNTHPHTTCRPTGSEKHALTHSALHTVLANCSQRKMAPKNFADTVIQQVYEPSTSKSTPAHHAATQLLRSGNVRLNSHHKTHAPTPQDTRTRLFIHPLRSRSPPTNTNTHPTVEDCTDVSAI